MIYSFEETVYAIGLLGAGVYLGAYFMLQMGILKGDSYTYSTLNIVAPVCVMISLITAFNMSSAIIQASWILISIVGITRNFLLSRFQRFSPEEEMFLTSYVPLLPRHLARTFLNTAERKLIQPGEKLTTQGQIAGHVAYIIDGQISVEVDGHPVGESRAGSYIGELTFFDSIPATATATAVEPTKCLIFSSNRLHDLLARKPEIQTAIITSFNNDTRHKLINSNLASIGLARQQAAE